LQAAVGTGQSSIESNALLSKQCFFVDSEHHISFEVSGLQNLDQMRKTPNINNLYKFGNLV